jgi:hypothetical protein
MVENGELASLYVDTDSKSNWTALVVPLLESEPVTVTVAVGLQSASATSILYAPFSLDYNTWTEYSDVGWTARSGCALVVVGTNTRLLLGGKQNTGFNMFFNDIYSSTSPGVWSLVESDTGWAPRQHHSCQVLDGKVWVRGIRVASHQARVLESD